MLIGNWIMRIFAWSKLFQAILALPLKHFLLWAYVYVDVISFVTFQLIANLEESVSCILDAWSKVLNSLFVSAFSNKNWKIELKIFETVSHITLSHGTIFTLKYWVFAKKADFNRLKGFLAIEGIFLETTHICILTYQIPNFWDNPNEF